VYIYSAALTVAQRVRVSLLTGLCLLSFLQLPLRRLCDDLYNCVDYRALHERTNTMLTMYRALRSAELLPTICSYGTVQSYSYMRNTPNFVDSIGACAAAAKLSPSTRL
jgi:hypothetical protein